MSAVASPPSRPRRRFRGSLVRAMVLVLVPLSLLPVLLMGSAAYFRSRALLLQQAEEQLDTVEDLLRNQVQDMLVAQHIRLDRLAHQGAFRQELEHVLNEAHFAPDFPAHREAMLSTFQLLNPPGAPVMFHDVAVLGLDGTVLVATRPEWEGLRLFERPYVGDMLGQDRSRMVWAPVPLYNNEAAILTTHVVRDVQGQAIAYLLGTTRMSAVQRMVEDVLRTQPDVQFYFVTEEGDFVGIPPREAGFTLLTPTESQKQELLNRFLPRVKRHPTQNADFTAEIRSVEEQPAFVVASWLAALETMLVAEEPQAVIFRQVNSLAPFTLLLLAGTTALLAILIWQGSTRLVAPLRELTQAAEHFATGDFRRRADVDRDDEIGQLAAAFNRMANDLSTLYRDLELRVAERTAQVQTASEVAELAISTTSLEELLRRTVQLIVERFPQYYQASVFLLDEARRFAVLRESEGPAAEEFKRRGHKLAVGSSSLVGWATANNRPRVASDVAEDPIHFKNPLLPETRSEAAIPIAVGDQVLGALDVQSRDPNAFDEAAVHVLQTLANQIAAAIRNFRLLESTQISLEETAALYEASREIAKAESVGEVLAAITRTVRHLPFITAVFVPDRDGLRLVSVYNPHQPEMKPTTNRLAVDFGRLRAILPGDQPLLVEDLEHAVILPPTLRELPRQMGCVSAAFVPVWRGETLSGLTVLGSPETGKLTRARLQPYASLAEVTATALDRIAALQASRQRLAELETVAGVSQAVAVETNLQRLYARIHDQVRQVMGDVAFFIALYDRETSRIEIPYLYEDGQVSHIEPFPLGEGLTSIVVHTAQPLLLVEDTERRAKELGAKIVGRAAKSWLGVPLIVAGEVIGVMAVQDLEQEQRFSEDDQRLLSAIAGQIAGAVWNARLLAQTQQQAEFERLLNQVTARIRQTTDIQRMLRIAAHEMRLALGAERVRLRLHLGADGDGEDV